MVHKVIRGVVRRVVRGAVRGAGVSLFNSPIGFVFYFQAFDCRPGPFGDQRGNSEEGM